MSAGQASTARQVSIRLRAEGGAEVRREAADVKESLVKAYLAGEGAADRATAAAERQMAAWRRMAAAAREAQERAQNQSAFSAFMGVSDAPSKSARESAEVFAAEAREMEGLQLRAEALRAALDPLAAAQRRLNEEIEGYGELARRGQISAEELTRAQEMARRKFEETAETIRRRRRDGGMMGAEAMGLLRRGVAGPLAALGLGAGVLGAAGLGLREAADAERVFLRLQSVLEATGGAAGRTGAQIEEMSRRAGRAAGRSRQELLSSASALASYTAVSGEEFDRALRVALDLSAVYGQDLRSAIESIGNALEDPVEGFARLRRQGFLLTEEQRRQIEGFVRVGDAAAAQRVVLESLEGLIGGAGAGQERGLAGAWTRARRAMAEYFEETVRSSGAPGFWQRGLSRAAEDIERAAEQLRLDRGEGPVGAVALNVVRRMEALNREAEFIRNRGMQHLYARRLAEIESELSGLSLRLDETEARGQREIAEQAAAREGARRAAEEARTQEGAARSRTIREAFDRAGTAREQIAVVNRELGETLEGLRALRTEANAAEVDDAIARAQEMARRRLAGLRDQIEAVNDNARENRALAAAYLQSGEAAERAEIAARALARSRRELIGAETALREETAAALAQRLADGARAVRAAEGEIDAQRALNAALADGSRGLAAAEAEARARAAAQTLAAAAAVAEGEARERLLEVIERTRAAQTRLAIEQARGEAIRNARQMAEDAAAQRELNDAVAAGTLSLRDAAEASRLRALTADLTALATVAEADAHAELADAVRDVVAAFAALRNEETRRAAQTLAQAQADSIERLQTELDLIRARPEERDRELARLALIQRMRGEGIDLESDIGRQLLDNLETEHRILRALREGQQARADQLRLAEQVFDRFGSLIEQGRLDWADWRDAGRQAIADILRELIRLVALNPLRNWLFGSSLTTAATAGGLFGQLFGGFGKVGRNSAGTGYWPGGWTWTGEHGPELVRLPRGAQVFEHGRSMALAANAGARALSVTINYAPQIHAEGAGPREIDELRALVEEERAVLPEKIAALVSDGVARGVIAA